MSQSKLKYKYIFFDKEEGYWTDFYTTGREGYTEKREEARRFTDDEIRQKFGTDGESLILQAPVDRWTVERVRDFDNEDVQLWVEIPQRRINV